MEKHNIVFYYSQFFRKNQHIWACVLRNNPSYCIILAKQYQEELITGIAKHWQNSQKQNVNLLKATK